ncbi:MAG: extracellular solute-binding protein [Gammaproteobacteria bacterium]|nr:extracellular solute-binding protein [Gammaproteobacteria bacterium]
MSGNPFLDKIAKRGLSRRDFNKALASAGLTMAAFPLLPKSANAEGEVTYFTWSGYDIPELHQGYISKYGGPPSFTLFGEEEEALAKMRSGFTPDLAHPCTYSVGRWRDAGLMKPIDVSRLANYADVWDDLKSLEIAHKGGDTWFIPFDWGNSSVLYRTDLVDQKYMEEESWQILYDEQYKGRLAIYDSVDGAVIVAALVTGVKDPFAMTEEELAKVRELMNTQRDYLRFYWTDQTSVEQGLASGELVASYAWNSSVVELKKQGLPVKYMNPKEGILTWVCGVMMVKDGKGDEAAAYDMVDSMLAPETGRYLIEEYGYGHSNRKSFDLVPTERLAELGISSPTDLFAQGIFFQEIEPSVRQKYIAVLEEVKAGS